MASFYSVHLIRLLLGITMLTMGRRLFWLFLGGTGFVLGFDLAERLLNHQPQSVILVVALCAGAAGALLAVFLQKLAVLVAGFLGGGYLFLELLRELGMGPTDYRWLLFIIGGILGALLMKVLFRWTLIILSSVVGAGLISQAFPISRSLARPIFLLLLGIGVAVQAGLIRGSASRRG